MTEYPPPSSVLPDGTRTGPEARVPEHDTSVTYPNLAFGTPAGDDRWVWR